jgi:hypothetical protein
MAADPQLSNRAAPSVQTSLRLPEASPQQCGQQRLSKPKSAWALAASCTEPKKLNERAGTPIGPLDTLIAAQAVARKLVLVSDSEREFSRVAGLRIENWAS